MRGGERKHESRTKQQKAAKASLPLMNKPELGY